MAKEKRKHIEEADIVENTESVQPSKSKKRKETRFEDEAMCDPTAMDQSHNPGYVGFQYCLFVYVVIYAS